MNYAASASIVSALCSPVLANIDVADHYQIGMHRFTIRDPPVQRPMSKPYQGPNSGGIPVFNPRYVQRELKKVMAKYEAAPQVLQGIGLSPQLNISFVNNFPAFDDPSAVAVPSNGNDSDSGPRVSRVSMPYSKQPLTDFMSGSMDVLYFGGLSIGTPPQKMSVDIDTGSSDLWVTSDCPECFSDQYDPDASSTYQDQNEYFDITYGTGEVSGSLGVDVVSLAGLQYANQTFGLAEVESHDFDGLPISGIMGTAFGSLSTSGQPTVFENLMASGQVLAPFFSVHMARAAKIGSEVCWGCYDVSKTKGIVTWVPTVSQTYWTVAMHGLSVNSTTINTNMKAAKDTGTSPSVNSTTTTTNMYAAIDTGTSLIYVPDSVAQDFYKLIPGAKQSDQFGSSIYTYPCASKLDIALNFGGTNFAINTRDFNLGRASANSTDCVGGIISPGSSFPTDLAIVGDEFLKSWYTVYDYSNGARVGFAPSINNI